MDRLMEYFAQMPTWHRFALVAVCMSCGWLAEDARPLMRHGYRKWRHAGVNLSFFAMVGAAGAFAGWALVGLFHWVETARIGLLQAVAWPAWLEMLVAVAALDLAAQYTAHVLLHKIGWLWRLHVVHHSDRHVDATTGTRIHPGDYLFRECLAAAAVVVFGIPIAFYLLYRSVTVLFTYATHANIDMPRGLDRVLSCVFVTPNMHKFHHHDERHWTDSNYGNVFSIWDRLFGTFVYDDPAKIRYGVDTFDERLTDDVMGQLKLPFR